jgi:hypothetical protein
MLIGCRIHPETCVPVRRVSRLAEPGRTCSGRVAADWTRYRIFVGRPLAENPITRLGPVPGDGDEGAAMPFAGREPLIECLNGVPSERTIKHDKILSRFASSFSL